MAAALLDRNVKLRLLLRDPEKATTLFGEQDEDLLQVPWSVCMVMARTLNGFVFHFSWLSIEHGEDLGAFRLLLLK